VATSATESTHANARTHAGRCLLFVPLLERLSELLHAHLIEVDRRPVDSLLWLRTEKDADEEQEGTLVAQ
jgi:hypothetical protein